MLTSYLDRVVQRLRRLRDKQETDGSIPSVITETTRSVSVAAARVCGMDEDRVQFPDGPLDKRKDNPMGDGIRLLAGRAS